MLGLEQLSEWWNGLLVHADPRIEGLLMMDSILWPIGVSTIYLVIVYLGPSLMKNRKPMELRNAMVAYNFLMVALSGYMFAGFYIYGWRHYSLGCQPIEISRTPQALKMVRICHLFFLSKMVELLDTIFFILRKKFSQMSFLHVSHHGLLPLTGWLGMKFVPGGFSTFQALLNSLIHALMYFYYGVAALGPEYQKYLWWKRYMTAAQLIQFTLIIVHSSQLFFIECDYPIIVPCTIIIQSFVFFVLFLHYWCQQYRQKRSTKTK